MRWSTLFVLVALVAVLAYFSLQQTRREDEGIGTTPDQFALLPGFAPERVVRLRIDHLERQIQVALERDSRGSWYVTDPVPYPALRGVIDALLRTLRSARGERVQSPELAKLGLDPPRVVLQVVSLEEQEETRTTIELGAQDLDTDQIYARVLGHPAAREAAAGAEEEALVVRTTRTLQNTLERNPDDYREVRATPVSAGRVVGFRRSGEVWPPDADEARDLDLVAQRTGGTWRRVDPPTVGLDPSAMGLVIRGAAELKVRAFEDDSPTSLEAWGLDPGVFSIELEEAGGDTTKLHFGFPRAYGPGRAWSEAWYCRREGIDQVWGIDSADVQLLTRPASDFYDYFLVRAVREDVRRVELTDGPRNLELRREGEGWVVSEAGSDGASPDYPAATGPVQDLLAAIEATELDYPEGLVFEPGERPRSIFVETKDGQRWGGAIGALWRDPESGRAGRHFQRPEDELSGLIEEDVADLCLKGVGDFRSAQILRIAPEAVHSVTLERGAQRFTYVHPDEKRWLVAGDDFPAPREFVQLTVHLFSLRAARWLEDPDAVSLEDPIDVTVRPRKGETLSFRLGRGPEGELLCLREGRLAVVDTGAQEALWGADLGAELRRVFGE